VSSLSFVKSVLRRRDAIVGLAIILFFALIALLAPLIAPFSNAYNPKAYFVASPDSPPAWARIFPPYSSLPPNIILPPTPSYQLFKVPSAIQYWQVLDPVNSPVIKYSQSGPVGVLPPISGAFVSYDPTSGSELVNLTGDSTTPVPLYLYHEFGYNYQPPDYFYAQLLVKPITVQGASLAIFLFVQNEKGVYPVALFADSGAQTYLESLPNLGSGYLNYFATNTQSTLNKGAWNFISAITTASAYMPLVYLNKSVNPLLVSQTLFSEKGEYKVGELILVIPHGKYTIALQQTDFKFQIFGKIYGLLGTDANGADVWSEFVTGTRLALGIGFGASAITMAIGVLLGLVAGFFGGFVDSALIFLFDFLLLLPGLILLIDLDTIFTITHAVPNKALLITLLLGFLGFAGVSRIVRSQVLSLKTRTYVQAAQVMGASNFYIVRSHILKHTAGTIIALVTYIVPGLVIADAGLDFLGIGIINTPTWGNILNNLLNQATASNGYLWWISLSVGLSIIALSVGFYLFGTAIQEEFSRFS